MIAMLRRIILGAVCAVEGYPKYLYSCPFCSFTAETDSAMGAHIAAFHPNGK